ncbi:MAG TPA: serine/threonine-protein kinase [Candidatus Acidoferrum sp.]|jgi:serine/threonine-protein kinase
MDSPQKIGRYEIVGEKGRGAMGAVYLARDPSMDRIVAVKTIHSLALSGPQGSEFRERFYREARAAGRLAHPGIVPVFDVGEQDDMPYLVMEYIEGHTLADAAKSGNRFTLERVSEIGQQIAEALGYAHKNGVVHRDIKPANILLTSRETYGIERPKITDFGVAKLSASHITTTGQMLGTPAFMPPEQFTGATIDGRSDLFSFGVILYWLATGEQAFPGETVTAVSYKVVHTEPVPPRKLNPAIPVALERVIFKCLAKDPAQRYQTGEELASDLAAVRSGRASADLQSTVAMPGAPNAPSGVDITLDSNASVLSVAPGVRQSGVRPATQGIARPSADRFARPIFAALMVAGLAAGGWYLHKTKTRAQIPEVVPSVTAASAPVVPDPPKNSGENKPVPEVSHGKATDAGGGSVAAAPAAKKAPKAVKTDDVAAALAAKNSPAKSSTEMVGPVAPPPEVPKPQPVVVAPARVDFDPTALNPSGNAKLKIEADRFPGDVDFTVELNGKIYFERGAAKSQTVFENLFVPPGVQELRVIAGSGTNRKTSNTVSLEFKAKKRNTLKIELRSTGQQSGNAGIPRDVYADSQVVVSLK